MPLWSHRPTLSTAPGLPPLRKLLMSHDLEDPVVFWLHRPIAYGLCKLVFRTPVVPTHLTLLRAGFVLLTAMCWVEGSRGAMVAGGALLWLSVILDGADGLLARAKNMQSSFGRALDGTVDLLVALSAGGAALYHLFAIGGGAPVLALGLAAAWLTALQRMFCDAYRDLHRRMTHIGGLRGWAILENLPGAQTSSYPRVWRRLETAYARSREALLRRTNRFALALHRGASPSEASAELYRATNGAVLRVWNTLGSGPHGYLLAIFGMLDRLELYLWMRLLVMNALLIVGLLAQRRASRRTLDSFRAHGWIP